MSTEHKHRSYTRRAFSANAVAAFSYFTGGGNAAAPKGAGTGGSGLGGGVGGASASDGSGDRTSMHPSHQPMYFSSVSADEVDPVFSYCLSTSHPDSVLRRNGIVRQEGVYKGRHVYFNPKSCLWHRVDNDEPMPGAMPYFLDDRFDKGPSGVIQIFGDDGVLSFDDMTQATQDALKSLALIGRGGGGAATSTTNVAGGGTNPLNFGGVGTPAATLAAAAHSGVGLTAQHRENLRLMERYHRTLTNPAEQDNTDANGMLRVTPEHQKRYIQQYLSRAIPEAARSANAVIVLTRGNSLVAQHVSDGIASLQRNTRVNIAASTNVVEALAVTPFREQIDPLHRGITHHVVLRRSMLSRMPRNVHDRRSQVRPCLGWLYYDAGSAFRAKSKLAKSRRQSFGGAPAQQRSLTTLDRDDAHDVGGNSRAESIDDTDDDEAGQRVVAANPKSPVGSRHQHQLPVTNSTAEAASGEECFDDDATSDDEYDANNLRKVCLFCGELPEWHAPYTVYRSMRVSSDAKRTQLEVIESLATAAATGKLRRGESGRIGRQWTTDDMEADGNSTRDAVHPPLPIESPSVFGTAEDTADPNHIASPYGGAHPLRGDADISTMGGQDDSSRTMTPVPLRRLQDAASKVVTSAALAHPPLKGTTDTQQQEPEELQRSKKKPRMISEEPNVFETDQFVGRIVDQLAVGCRRELLIPGRRSAKSKFSFADLFMFKSKRPPIAPDRPQIPVVVILVGGEPQAAKRYLTQCITRRYTILILEGSGGYADYLGHIKRRIEKAFPYAGRDIYSTALDPLTAEILSSTDLVKFIRPGAKNEELTREIDGALKGEGVLSGVWRLYARVQANAKYQAQLFTLSNIFQMLLSLFVTFLTALQTYLLLQMVRKGEGIPPTFPAEADERGSWFLWRWTAMQWSIILLPISISALQAFASKADYGAKWIALRTMSHRLLSEIYQYRTSCLLYHEGAVERQRAERDAGEGGADAGGGSGVGGGGGDGGHRGKRVGLSSTTTAALSYKSREDLLQMRAAELDRQTQEGACKQLNLFDNAPSAPPKNILEIDDGFSALTPDQYVRVRLRRMVDVLERDALFFTQLLQWCQNGITLANGFGTGLAAVAAFTDGTIQAWLAFTTAFVATLLRMLEGFRLEFQMRKKVQTARSLRGIGAWWGSLRERADNQQNRDWLVEQVESAILDEVDAWAQQFGQALETMKKGAGGGHGDAQDDGSTDDGGPDSDENGEHGNDGDDGEGGAPATLKGLELAELSVVSLRKVLMDPTAPTKLKEQTIAKIKKLKAKLIETNGGAPLTSKARREQELQKLCIKATEDECTLQEGRNRRGEAVSVASMLVFPSLGDADALPAHVEDILNNRPIDFIGAIKEVMSERKGIVEDDIASSRTAGGALDTGSRRSSKVDSSGGGLLAKLDRRHSKMDDAASQESLVAASQISYCDCVMALRRLEELAADAERLSHRHILELCKRVTALQLIAFLTYAVDRVKIREMCSAGTTVDDLVAQFCSIALTPNVSKFSLSALLQLIRDPQLRNNLAVLPDSEAFFHRLVAGCLEAFSPSSFPFAVYQRITEMVAEIDVDMIMADTSSGVALARSVETLLRFGIRPWVLQKADLVVAFPESMRSVISHRSHFQLAAYLDQALSSKPSLVSVDHLLHKFGTVVFPSSFLQFLRSKREHQVVFASIVESLTQADILTKPMHHLIRLIDISFSSTADGVGERIHQEQLLSSTKNNTSGGAQHQPPSNDAKIISDMKDRIGRLPVANLRIAFSILQTIHSNTYGASIVDRTCDSIVDFSLREVLNYENVVRLVAKLPELKAYNLHRCCRSRKLETLKIFGFKKLTEALDNLSDNQLRTIFYAFQYANPTDWTLDQVACTLRAYLDVESESAQENVHRISRDPMYMSKAIKEQGGLPGRDATVEDETSTPADVEELKRRKMLALSNFFSEEWVRDIMSWTGKTLLCLEWASAQTTLSKLSGQAERMSSPQVASFDEPEEDPQPTTARTRHRNLENIMEDAPDAMAKRALKALDPRRAREVLRLIQPCGVEADVARVFGIVLAQGGYEDGHTEALQQAFRRWQVRQAAVEVVGVLLLDESAGRDTGNNIFDMDAKQFVEIFTKKLRAVHGVDAVPDVDRRIKDNEDFVSVQQQDATLDPWHPAVVWVGDAKPLLKQIDDDCLAHLNAKGGPPVDVVKDFLSNLMTELRLSAPLLVFYRLASLCSFLDIRELFDTVEERTELVVLLSLVVMDGSELFTEKDASITRKAVAAMRESSPDDDCLLSGDDEEEATNAEAMLKSHVSAVKRADQHPFSLFEHQIYSDISSIDCAAMGLGDGRATNTLQKGYWRLRVLTAIHLQYESKRSQQSTPSSEDDSHHTSRSYGLERVASFLHSLSEPQLRFLFECHARVLKSTIGRLLQKVVTYKRYGGRERYLFPILRTLSVRDSFVFDIALSSLIRNIKIFPTEMSISLDHLEPQKFASRSETERRSVLSMWMNAGSHGPLDILLKASTLPSSLLSHPLGATMRRPPAKPLGTPNDSKDDLLHHEDEVNGFASSAQAPAVSRHSGSLVFSQTLDRAHMRRDEGRQNLRFLTFIFDMIKAAKPDDGRSSLECVDSKNESKLATIMRKAQGWRVLVMVNRFAAALKQAGARNRDKRGERGTKNDSKVVTPNEEWSCDDDDQPFEEENRRPEGMPKLALARTREPLTRTAAVDGEGAKGSPTTAKKRWGKLGDNKPAAAAAGASGTYDAEKPSTPREPQSALKAHDAERPSTPREPQSALKARDAERPSTPREPQSALKARDAEKPAKRPSVRVMDPMAAVEAPTPSPTEMSKVSESYLPIAVPAHQDDHVLPPGPHAQEGGIGGDVEGDAPPSPPPRQKRNVQIQRKGASHGASHDAALNDATLPPPGDESQPAPPLAAVDPMLATYSLTDLQHSGLLAHPTRPATAADMDAVLTSTADEGGKDDEEG